jgi:heat shock protein 4
MSVAGFDVGNDTSVVALARRKGIDVVLNSESGRLTPSMVAFTSKQRFRGCVAGNNLATNPTNTVNSLKRMLGKKFSDPVFQKELEFTMFKCVAGPDDEPLITVQYLGEEKQFTPTQAMGMLLGELKTIAELDQGSKITDCVITIPAFFSDAERRAMLDSAAISGLNTLRLMHENTATALAYGIYKTDLPEKDAINVAFVDVGHASFQVNIVAFKKGQLKVLAHGFDRSLGGRDLDEAMMKHFAAQFEAKHKVDPLVKPRSRLRLRVAVEKLKKILSANPEGVLAVECLHEEIDFQSNMSRDELEAIAISTLSRVKDPLSTCLADSGLAAADISSVELVGSASRIPAVVKIVQDFFGQDIKRTLNASESAARGAALQGAMLSPAFKVRDFEVQDSFPFSYAFTWATADEQGKPTHTDTTEVLFPKGTTFLPTTKALTLSRSAQFDMKALVVDGEMISTFTVGPIPPNKETEGVPKLKVMLKLDLHGIVKVDGVQAVEEVVVPVEAPPAPAAPAPKEGEEAPKEGEEAAMEEDKPAEEPKIKTKKIKTDVQVTTKAPGTLAPGKLTECIEKEFEMCLQDKVMEETKERKNAVEEYVYNMRNKLCDELAEYITDADKETFNALLEKTEDWLYDEGEDETKGVYAAKMEELQKMGGPVAERFEEAQTRGSAAQTLETVCGVFMAQCADAKFEHIDEAERAKVVKECTEAKEWLADKVAQQAALPKTSPPAVLTKEMIARKETIERFCKPIMSKPKPAPKPEEKAAEPEAKPAEEEPMETEEAAAAEEVAEPMQADLD